MSRLFASIKNSLFRTKAPVYKSYSHQNLRLIALRTRVILQQKYKKLQKQIVYTDNQFKNHQVKDVTIQKRYEILQNLGKKVIQAESIKIYVQIIRKIQFNAQNIIITNGDISLLKQMIKWFQSILWYRKCKNITNIQQFYDFCFNFFHGVDITMEINVKCDIFILYPVLKYIADGIVIPLHFLIEQVTPYASFQISQQQLDYMNKINIKEIKHVYLQDKRQCKERILNSKSPRHRQITPTKKLNKNYAASQLVSNGTIQPTNLIHNQTTNLIVNPAVKKELQVDPYASSPKQDIDNNLNFNNKQNEDEYNSYNHHNHDSYNLHNHNSQNDHNTPYNNYNMPYNNHNTQYNNHGNNGSYGNNESHGNKTNIYSFSKHQQDLASKSYMSNEIDPESFMLEHELNNLNTQYTKSNLLRLNNHTSQTSKSKLSLNRLFSSKSQNISHQSLEQQDLLQSLQIIKKCFSIPKQNQSKQQYKQRQQNNRIKQDNLAQQPVVNSPQQIPYQEPVKKPFKKPYMVSIYARKQFMDKVNQLKDKRNFNQTDHQHNFDQGNHQNQFGQQNHQDQFGQQDHQDQFGQQDHQNKFGLQNHQNKYAQPNDLHDNTNQSQIGFINKNDHRY